MHIVAIHDWQNENPDFVRVLAEVLGITPYEVRQRLIGDGPAVIACFADPQLAVTIAGKLPRNMTAALIVDSAAVRNDTGSFLVRSFELSPGHLRIKADGRPSLEIKYEDIELLLTGIQISALNGTKTVTERKFSLGKTILSGGIPMTSTVKRQEEVTTEERENILRLYAHEQPPVIFSQSALSYDGFGTAMKLSMELNFSYLKSELRRLCPTAGYDDRLLSRPGQVRLLGPALNPEKNLDLAFAILARTLRRRRAASRPMPEECRWL